MIIKGVLSVLNDYMENLAIMEKRTVSDGMGGYEVSWIEGATFRGAISTDNSIQTRIAEQQGVKSLYTIVVDINVPITFNDVVKREETGDYLRITSRPDDTKTPARARVQNKQMQAELYILEQ